MMMSPPPPVAAAAAAPVPPTPVAPTACGFTADAPWSLVCPAADVRRGADVAMVDAATTDDGDEDVSPMAAEAMSVVGAVA